MEITVHTVTYNEEILIQFMIDHYRTRFPHCHFVVYDNKSTDNTLAIAKHNNCDIRPYDSMGLVDDLLLWQTKDNCWRNARTDWVVVCDLDELLDINEEQLKQEEALGSTKIKSESWQMVNMEDNLDIKNIKHGYRDVNDPGCLIYDKDLMFNKKYIKDIHYEGGGCHSTNSKGLVKNSKPYKLYHYKYVNPDVFAAKQKVSASRLSEINKKYSWGKQCLRQEHEFYAEFQKMRESAIKILP